MTTGSRFLGSRVEGNENVLKLIMVMIPQLCEYTKNIELYTKWPDCMVCDLHFHKGATKILLKWHSFIGFLYGEKNKKLRGYYFQEWRVGHIHTNWLPFRKQIRTITYRALIKGSMTVTNKVSSLPPLRIKPALSFELNGNIFIYHFTEFGSPALFKGTWECQRWRKGVMI